MHFLLLRTFHILVHLAKVSWLLTLPLIMISLHAEIYFPVLNVLLAILLKGELAHGNSNVLWLLTLVLLKHSFLGCVELRQSSLTVAGSIESFRRYGVSLYVVVRSVVQVAVGL